MFSFKLVLLFSVDLFECSLLYVNNNNINKRYLNTGLQTMTLFNSVYIVIYKRI